ncbi:hypothetical protein HPB49_025088 [Dermacentor silvarum]|uniref:Uncharacterized protein n=1 Tax=Dermacentor silvarum TaxID=543639 RepID=A0ACB8C656_DERSI|nr:hypothetical protein HPB49_025088 [Dermacentor silvarum]
MNGGGRGHGQAPADGLFVWLPGGEPRDLPVNKTVKYRFFFMVAFSAYIVVNVSVSMRMVDVAGSQFLEFLLKAATLLSNLLFSVYDVLHFVVLRPCCEVIVSYIRHQRYALKTTLETGHGFAMAKLTGADDELEAVRMNLSSIGKLKRMINATWQFTIIESATVILIVSCICIYCTFDEGVTMDQFTLMMTYCFYSVVDFADVVRLSQKMSNEVRELKEYLMKAPIFHEPTTRCGQLAGSIITYSVILVQTSDSLSSLALAKSNHTGAP